MFEQMCYLVVCRQKANLERRRLLYKFYRIENAGGKYQRRVNRLKRAFSRKAELKAYRDQADFMRDIAVKVYSPLRRSINAFMKYDGNNMVQAIFYQGEQFDYKRIQEIAASYEFDSIVLNSNKISNPYNRE